MSIVFIRNAVSVEFPAYTHDFGQELDPGTVVAETQGGTVISQDIVPTRTFWRLQFSHLTGAQIALLQSFYLSTIRGAYYPFTFFDYDATNDSSGGNSYQVRWWNPWAFRRNPNAEDSYGGMIVLREE